MDYTYDDLLETFLKRFLRVEGNTARITTALFS